MAKDHLIGAQRGDNSDWTPASEFTSPRLLRGPALADMALDHPSVSMANSTAGRRVAASSAALSAQQVVATDLDQVARAIADIEQATVTLRKAEPALQAWHPDGTASAESRKPLPLWLLIGGIWMSAALAVAGVVEAVLYFVR
jgi:hypothetical protein